MSLIAAIDIGTNSLKMTIADAEDRRLTVLQNESKTTRLGKDVDQTGRLADPGMDATLAELKRLRGILDDHHVTDVAVVGTSALRDAGNGAEFLKRVKDEVGFEIEIVSGDREAELAYRAVISDTTIGIDIAKPLIVFDLGGGSTELNFGFGSKILAHKSVDIGAVRITERCIKSDPPTQSEIDNASKMASDIIASAGMPAESHGAQVAGLGGTLVNIAALLAAGKGDPHGKRVTSQNVAAVLHKLRSMPTRDRKAIPGIDPDRADVLIGGALIAAAVLAAVDSQSYTVSTRGLRFGLLGEMAERTYPGLKATPPATGRG